MILETTGYAKGNVEINFGLEEAAVWNTCDGSRTDTASSKPPPRKTRGMIPVRLQQLIRKPGKALFGRPTLQQRDEDQYLQPPSPSTTVADFSMTFTLTTMASNGIPTTMRSCIKAKKVA